MTDQQHLANLEQVARAFAGKRTLLRQWAIDNGHTTSDVGCLKHDVLKAFHQAEARGEVWSGE